MGARETRNPEPISDGFRVSGSVGGDVERQALMSVVTEGDNTAWTTDCLR